MTDEVSQVPVASQTAGKLFEEFTKEFIEAVFLQLHHLAPGEWRYSTDDQDISFYDQYRHLAELRMRIREDATLAATLGSDYFITPDIIVSRSPFSDEDINLTESVIDKDSLVARLTPMRRANHPEPGWILHASISCKWTIRSDRAQNIRAEALNLVRNRKGRLPHILAVTAEPLPTRLNSLALGTGDLDCVYHFALNELIASVERYDSEGQSEALSILLEGRRLRDISDLPFDLLM